jgi:hypothetical protein
LTSHGALDGLGLLGVEGFLLIDFDRLLSAAEQLIKRAIDDKNNHAR